MMLEKVTIGWFGVPGTQRHTSVHLRSNGKSVCGYTPNSKYEFQWCSSRSSGIEFVECKKCQKIILESMDKKQKTNFTKTVNDIPAKRMWSAIWYRWFS